MQQIPLPTKRVYSSTLAFRLALGASAVLLSAVAVAALSMQSKPRIYTMEEPERMATFELSTDPVVDVPAAVARVEVVFQAPAEVEAGAARLPEGEVVFEGEPEPGYLAAHDYEVWGCFLEQIDAGALIEGVAEITLSAAPGEPHHAVGGDALGDDDDAGDAGFRECLEGAAADWTLAGRDGGSLVLSYRLQS